MINIIFFSMHFDDKIDGLKLDGLNCEDISVYTSFLQKVNIFGFYHIIDILIVSIKTESNERIYIG